MENLKIEKTKDSFGIDFQAETGVLEMAGSSYPENAVEFFRPIDKWLNTYISDIKKSIIANLRITYLNTSSSKCILDLLELLDEYHQSGGSVKVNWYYEEDDEDIQEAGEDLCEDLKLPYELIPYKEE